jgi:hypothetical protein
MFSDISVLVPSKLTAESVADDAEPRAGGGSATGVGGGASTVSGGGGGISTVSGGGGGNLEDAGMGSTVSCKADKSGKMKGSKKGSSKGGSAVSVSVSVSVGSSPGRVAGTARGGASVGSVSPAATQNSVADGTYIVAAAAAAAASATAVASMPAAMPVEGDAARDGANMAPATDDESLVLMLQGPHEVKMLDAIRGAVLTSFDLRTGGLPVAVSAAWDIPTSLFSTLSGGGGGGGGGGGRSVSPIPAGLGLGLGVSAASSSMIFLSESPTPNGYGYEARGHNFISIDTAPASSQVLAASPANSPRLGKSTKSGKVGGRSGKFGAKSGISERLAGRGIDETESSQVVSVSSRGLTGLCIAQDMRIFVFGEQVAGETFRQHRLHDQQPAAPVLYQSMSYSQSMHGHTAPMMSRGALPQLQQSQLVGATTAAAPAREFSALDNLVQGVCLRELVGYSPLAAVWSLRRLVLLRMQLQLSERRQRGAEVLRSAEYVLSASQDNVRVVFASALKSRPRMRNHKAVVVLSNGHVLVVHL